VLIIDYFQSGGGWLSRVHRQSGTSTDELKDLGGRKSRVMVDRYAKFATEHLAVAAARIESGLSGTNVGNVLRFPYGGEMKLG
jgi:hypothetical protein